MLQVHLHLHTKVVVTLSLQNHGVRLHRSTGSPKEQGVTKLPALGSRGTWTGAEPAGDPEAAGLVAVPLAGTQLPSPTLVMTDARFAFLGQPSGTNRSRMF